MRTGTGEHLELVLGNRPGESFRVIADSDSNLVVKGPGADANVVHGEVPPGWIAVFVITMRNVRGEKHYRFFDLAPSTERAKLEHGPFYVKGRFDVVRTINNAREAREEWENVRATLGLLRQPDPLPPFDFTPTERGGLARIIAQRDQAQAIARQDPGGAASLAADAVNALLVLRTEMFARVLRERSRADITSGVPHGSKATDRDLAATQFIEESCAALEHSLEQLISGAT